MSDSLDRRSVLKGGAAAAAVAMTSVGEVSAAAQEGLNFDTPVAFSYDLLKAHARERANAPYAPPPRPAPEIVQKINYEEWGKIRFRSDHALFADGPERFPLTFFHLGLFFQKAVEMHVVEGELSKRIVYEQSYFDMPSDSVARQLPQGAGFAGFRIQEARDGALDWRKNDWVAFLGAAYFRSIGELHQYGMSARGIALDVAVADRPEEFPDFTNFYIDSKEGQDSLVIYALMEGPSIVGVYRFLMQRTKGVVMDIETTLFTRAQVSRFGIAPLTSMYWFSETKKETAIDWRPEVHDSDGLSMWSGKGERLWRPLNNPPRIMVSSFLDENPRGFGLCQRDRVFDHYLDGVFYDRRPTVWVEPLPSPQGQGWGKGSIQLCEIPTDDEIHDNIVAMWVPEKPVPAGAELNLNYRLHWLADEPYPTKLGRCVATRLGRGGQPGLPRPKGVRKFVVEFLGGPLSTLAYGVKPEMVVTASRGSLQGYRIVEAVPDDVPGHWRLEFDLTVEGTDPVELRCFLQANGETLTETWMFQYHPF
ncbi:MAG TPA: glucan biosynthesis protein D [Roseiarcus sp.]|jgi:glucans biosynthesis protein